MTFITFILRNVQRRPGRSALTMLGVTFAVAGFVVLYGLSEGLRESGRVSLGERGVHLIVAKRGQVEFFSSVLPESLIDEIRKAPGVADATQELAGLVTLGEDHQALVAGFPPESFEWASMALADGDLPRPGAGEVLVGDLLAEALGKRVGDTVELEWVKLRISGITRFGASLNRSLVVAPLADLQKLMMRPGQATLFEVRLAEPGKTVAVEAARAALAALRPDLTVNTADDLLRQHRAMDALQRIASVLALLSLAIASLSVLNTMAMAVEERTREIGVLSAIGWSRGRILAAIVGEGVIVAAAGGALGGALGYAGSQALSDYILPGFGVTAAAKLHVTAAAGLAALGIGALGAFLPSWRASRLNPAAALRHQ